MQWIAQTIRVLTVTRGFMTQKQRLFEGCIVALVTPMCQADQIDYRRVEQLIEWHVKAGTRAIVVLGTTGESTSLTNEEYIELVKFSMRVSSGRVPIIIGCGLPSTNKTIELIEQINLFKPAAILSVVPCYVKPSQEGLYRHFCKIADASQSPVILYNVPSRTACDLQIKTVIKLAKHTNIVGIKEATGDLSRVEAILTGVENEFSLLSGDDESAYDFIKAGGHGVISVTANLMPETMNKWCELALQGSFDAASRVFDSTMPLHKALFVESNPIPVKWALSELNKIESSIRLPLTEPSTLSQQSIKKAMQQCGIV